jgi:hypothetical protein
MWWQLVPVLRSFEHGSELSSSMKGEELFERM